jgi:outer membrane protein assembly factor BamB
MRCEFFQPPSDDPPNVLSYAPTTRSEYMSYNPGTGYFYIEGIDRMQWEWNSPQPSTWEFNVSGYMTARVPNIDKQAVMTFAAVDPKTYKIVWKKQMRMPSTVYGVGGWLTTAGDLAFHRLEDGNLVAYDAKTGDELWKFQTGVVGTSTASPMSYEVDGQQYVAVIEDTQVWAFRLGGKIPQMPAPKLPALDDIFGGRMQQSLVIRTAVPDEYNYKHDISPLQDTVRVGSQVTFLNNGSDVYTFVSDDGSWTTGPLLPRQTAILTFDKPGTYLYHFKEYPWSYGLLVVTRANAPAPGGEATGRTQ